MNKEIDFETNLIISYDKFEIFLLDIKSYKNIYYKKFKFGYDPEKINFNLLSEFIENNIFKIEKLAGNFVNNINVVIENKLILTSDISIKKKNDSGEVTSALLQGMLTDIKELFKENYYEYQLMHMIINKYIIDGKSYSSLDDQIVKNKICLEIKIILISNLIILEIENILKRYQIKVDNYFDKKYIENFLNDERLDVSIKTHKLSNGLNANEVRITSKIVQKQGFFEKFFQLFS